jgi:hypothetical protein
MGHCKPISIKEAEIRQPAYLHLKEVGGRGGGMKRAEWGGTGGGGWRGGQIGLQGEQSGSSDSSILYPEIN